MKGMQKEVDHWIKQHKIHYFEPLSILARLTEEVGELARDLNNKYGDRVKKKTEHPEEIDVELADVVFTVICLANSLGIDLDKAFDKVMAKCYGRDKNRYEKK